MQRKVGRGCLVGLVGLAVGKGVKIRRGSGKLGRKRKRIGTRPLALPLALARFRFRRRQNRLPVRAVWPWLESNKLRVNEWESITGSQ